MFGKGHGGLYKSPTERENARLRGEGDEIKFVDFRLKEGKLYDSGKEEKGNTFHELHVFGMNGDLWDRVCGLGDDEVGDNDDDYNYDVDDYGDVDDYDVECDDDLTDLARN